MDRRRAIAAAPFRSSTQAWTVIEELITNTLTASEHITGQDVRTALQAAAQVGRHLAAGDYLTKYPLVLVAGSLRLEIRTVTGDEALVGGDDAAAVPGTSTARDWTLYLPHPEPLSDLVRRAAKANSHLSSDDPPDIATEAKAATSGIDRDAIRHLRGDAP
jgi:hypothetical protein